MTPIHHRGAADTRASFRDDLVGRRLSWQPLCPGGANFQTAALTLRDGALRVRATPAMVLFCLAFCMAGAWLMGTCLQAVSWRHPAAAPFVVMVLGSAFVLVGFWMIRKHRPFTLDKSAGIYYRGRVPERSRVRTDYGRLADIHAVQVIAEHISRSRDMSSYTSVEINLVCRDGTRINVLDHGDRAAIDAAAELLSTYLAVPVWERDD